jgi:hypothetical protein
MVYRFDADRVLRLIASGDLDAAQVLLDEAAKAAVAPWADVISSEELEAAMLDLTGSQIDKVFEVAEMLNDPIAKRERLEANLCQTLIANRLDNGAALLKAVVEALDDCLGLDSLDDETFDAFANLAFVGRASDPFQQWRIAVNAARTFRDRGDADRARVWYDRVPVEQGDSDILQQVYRDLGQAIDAME